MADTNKLEAAVQFLLDEHLKGEPVDDAAKERFATAQAHKDAIAPSAPVEEVKVEVPPVAPQAPAVPIPVVPSA